MTGQPTNLNFEGGLEALYYELSDFARVAAPYLHSFPHTLKTIIRNEKNVLIKFNASNV